MENGRGGDADECGGCAEDVVGLVNFGDGVEDVDAAEEVVGLEGDGGEGDHEALAVGDDFAGGERGGVEDIGDEDVVVESL